MEKVEPLLSAVGRENGRATGKPFGGFSNNEMQSPHDPGVSLLSTRPRGPKTSAHTNTCTQTVIAALFARAKKWKQLTCPSRGEWLNGMWSAPTMEQDSVTERKGSLTQAAVWVNLETTLLRERSQAQRPTLYDSMDTGHPEQTNPYRQGAGGAADWAGGGEIGKVAKGHRISSRGGETFQTACHDACTHLHKAAKLSKVLGDTENDASFISDFQVKWGWR